MDQRIQFGVLRAVVYVSSSLREKIKQVLKILVVTLIAYTSPLAAGSPLGLPPITIPQNNAQSPKKIALGRLLFHDVRFSANGTVSCASCHQQAKAFTDGLPVAQGINRISGPRNTPTVVNAAFYTSFFLDGRRNSLETQALDPLVNDIEHGLENHQEIIKIIRGDKTYGELFKDVFCIDRNKITIDHVVKSIASYERTLLAGDSPFDRFFFAGDKGALSKSAARGLNIFRRKGNCANCHEITWNQALFTDNRFYNLGIGFTRVNEKLANFVKSLKSIPADYLGTTKTFFDENHRSELGRFMVTGVIRDIGKFRTPTLRNIERTAPYMHDGSIKNLNEVVEYYNRGGDKNRFLDPAIFPLHLTDQEKIDLVEFLKALTSPEYTQSP